MASGSSSDAAAVKGDDKENASGSGSGWELLYCGGTKFESMDQEGVSRSQGNLLFPTRLRSLVNVNICFVATGCTACHCVALDAQGQCYTWGRNKKGQLGQGDTLLRNLPTVVKGLSGNFVQKASVGRNHTVVVTTAGDSLSFGDNKHGQLGTGSLDNESEVSPVGCRVKLMFFVERILLSGCQEYLALRLQYCHSQYGQLGHGSDNERNAKDSSGIVTYDPQPQPQAIKTLKDTTIVKVACGANLAVDSTGVIYTWGHGEHGRLGHGEVNDELEPRAVKFFENINISPKNVIVSAGSASSACTNGATMFYMWGKLDADGAQISSEPKEVNNLRGWSLQHIASGNKHHIAAGEGGCFSWGAAVNGELGYGPSNREKYLSSGKPKTIDILAGMHVTSVGCGYGLSMFTVDRAIGGSRIRQLCIYEGGTSMEEAKEPSESESELDDNGDESDPGYGESKAKAKRGRGVKRKTPVPKRRGRGQPDDTESSALEIGRSGRGVNRGQRDKRGRRGRQN